MTSGAPPPPKGHGVAVRAHLTTLDSKVLEASKEARAGPGTPRRCQKDLAGPTGVAEKQKAVGVTGVSAHERRWQTKPCLAFVPRLEGTGEAQPSQ